MYAKVKSISALFIINFHSINSAQKLRCKCKVYGCQCMLVSDMLIICGTYLSQHIQTDTEPVSLYCHPWTRL